VPSTVKIIELLRWWTVRAFSGQNNIALQMIDSTCLLRSKSNSSTDDGQYVSFQVKIIELPRWWNFDLRRHVLSIIWGAISFWPEKTCTVHHLGSSMILTWEGTYCPSSGELYDFDLRRRVLSIIWGALSFWSENTRIVHHLRSSMIFTGQYVCSQVKIIELPRWWTVRVFSSQNHRAPQMMDSACLLKSKS
jgi:hypothetical protein